MGGPKIDKAAIAKQEKAAADQEARLALEEKSAAETSRTKQASRMRARSGAGAGGSTLLSGLETGLRATLG